VRGLYAPPRERLVNIVLGSAISFRPLKLCFIRPNAHYYIVKHNCLSAIILNQIFWFTFESLYGEQGNKTLLGVFSS
jgi:hypothetical protein